MITTTRPGVGEYAPSFADYVDRIGDDEDIVAIGRGDGTPLPSFDDQAYVAAGHVRHHLQILEERYT